MAEKRSTEALLEQLVEAETQARALHGELRGMGWAAVRGLLEGGHAAPAARAAEGGELRLFCLARLVGEFEGPQVVDALLDLMAAEFPQVRTEAGEQLQGLALDHPRIVAAGIQRGLERLPKGSPALLELPYLLAEIQHPEILSLFERFLGHGDPNVVAASIEALVLLGDPAAVQLLEPLLEDQRMSALAQEESESFEATVGELAAEAVELLQHAGGAAEAGERG